MRTWLQKFQLVKRPSGKIRQKRERTTVHTNRQRSTHWPASWWWTDRPTSSKNSSGSCPPAPSTVHISPCSLQKHPQRHLLTWYANVRRSSSDRHITDCDSSSPGTEWPGTEDCLEHALSCLWGCKGWLQGMRWKRVQVEHPSWALLLLFIVSRDMS